MTSPITQPGYGRGRRPGNAGLTYPPEALSEDEVHELLAANNKRRSVMRKRDGALIILLWRTGLRITEALDLRVKDVDFENHAVNVLRGKGNKRRTVGIDGYALRHLKNWLDVRQAPMGAPIFCSRSGGRLHATYVRGVLKRLAETARVDKRVHPHMFRHTLAAELAREGVPAAIIQRQLGHSSLNTTTRYLATIAPTEVIDIMMKRDEPKEDE